MALLKFCVLVVIVAVCAGQRRKRAVTNCDELKNCLTSVAAKSGCGCGGSNYQNDIDQVNACLKQNNVRDRCPDNRANYVCYNYMNQQCETEVETCYAKYHEDVSATEETALYRCLGM